MKRISLLASLILSCICLGEVYLFANQYFDPKEYKSQSKFALNNSTLSTNSAFVELTDEFFSGQTKALKILFTSERITEEVRDDILKNDARKIRKKDHVYFVLFIDKTNKIWQVNLTIVIPGLTVVRTVAWKPEELKEFSSSFSYDGQRLRFKNKGSYKESSLNLAWDVNLDIPVVHKLGLDNK